MTGIRPIAAAAALALLTPLAACSDADTASKTDAGGEGDASQRTLASAIGEGPGLTTVSTALSEAGLGDVFDGPGSYTVLAPGDDAFIKLGDGGKTLTEAERRAELVALLRGHVLPGHLTPAAIKKAIADKKGPVTMRTLDDGAVTFAADGDAITVTGKDGSKARIAGEALVASNGVVLPLDGFVKKTPPAPAG